MPLLRKAKNTFMTWRKERMYYFFKGAIEGVGLILSECWKVYYSNNPQINYFHKMAALKLALLCNSEMMNFTMNGSTVLSINRITDRANRLGLLDSNSNSNSNLEYQQE